MFVRHIIDQPNGLLTLFEINECYLFKEDIWFFRRTCICRRISTKQYVVSFALRGGHVDNGDVKIDTYHVVAREPGEHKKPQ